MLVENNINICDPPDTYGQIKQWFEAKGESFEAYRMII